MSSELPEIPVYDLGGNWPVDLFEREIERARGLLISGSRHFPAFAVRLADRLSRSWLERSENPYLAEIDTISARLEAPGVYFLNVNYEWGCTSGVIADSDRGMLLRRVLDWPIEGLGSGIVAVRICARAGVWINVTWPGFTGSIQGLAPGRFAAAIHQAPMARRTAFKPLDWLLNRSKVWSSTAIPPAHLLRQVFETCGEYAEAKRVLSETELALPAIFLLSGTGENEGCVIERSETGAILRPAPTAAANHWQSRTIRASARGKESEARSAAMFARQRRTNDIGGAFDWLEPPILNDTTRLVMIANAASGELYAQGLEQPGRPWWRRSPGVLAQGATSILHIPPVAGSDSLDDSEPAAGGS